MHVTLVHIHVIAAYRDAFIAASRSNHEASVQEAGNLRFDILQSAEDPNYFVFYEAYRGVLPPPSLAGREKGAGDVFDDLDSVARFVGDGVIAARDDRAVVDDQVLPPVDVLGQLVDAEVAHRGACVAGCSGAPRNTVFATLPYRCLRCVPERVANS